MIFYEDIKYLNSASLTEEQILVQDQAIKSAVTQTEKHLSDYKKKAETFNGTYICADTFKETFADFNLSKMTRCIFNNVVHNSAATLANEQFCRVIDSAEPGKEVIFITGIPGAGKSSTIESFRLEEGLNKNICAVFEGQVANSDSVIEKIQKCLNKDLNVSVFVIDTPSEIALINTFKRFEEYGRGASTHIMAHIKAETASGLEKIQANFGEKISLIIADRSDFYHTTEIYKGWEHIPLLKREGNYNEIKQKLDSNTEQLFREGKINEMCYRQARSLPFNGRMVYPGRSQHDQNGDGFSVPGKSEETEQELIFSEAQEIERSQRADIESTYDALFSKKLDIMILAKNQQVQKLEEKLINRINAEKIKLNTEINKSTKTGIKGFFLKNSSKIPTEVKSLRLGVLTSRLGTIQTIMRQTREGIPKLEYLAHKKIRFHYPDLVKNAEEERQQKRNIQSTKNQSEQVNELKKSTGRVLKF